MTASLRGWASEAGMVAERGGRRKHENTPLGKTAKQKSYTDAPPPEEQHRDTTPPPAPGALPAKMLYRREWLYALATAAGFERWLAFHIAAQRIPLDAVMPAVNLLLLYVEANLVARVQWRHLFEAEEEVDEPEDWAPRTSSEALAVGLHPKRRRPQKLPPATLPGCNGSTSDGQPCAKLRRYGEKFCPSCRHKELERIRCDAAGE